ncbi:MAG: hypothetical protein ACK47B_08685 [Armatimonadota bacterium]
MPVDYQLLAWGGEWVAIRPASGQVFLLASVSSETCPVCHYGLRLQTVWLATPGEVSRLSWCQSCFNADWDSQEGVPLHAETQAALRQAVCGATFWPGARPAVEHLLQTGLVPPPRADSGS